jgi:hypothetical protein
MNFREWLFSEAKTDRILVYHGTSPALFPKIMSQGLIPDPPNRNWSDDDNTGFYGATRKSLDGIYVSTNLITALSAATNGQYKIHDGRLLVIAEVQPKTGFMDEDDINRFVSVTNNEYMTAALFGAIANTPKDEFVQDFWNKYWDEFMRVIKNKGEVHPKLEERLRPLVWQLFVKANARQAAHLDDWSFRKARDYGKAVKPEKSKAEQDFLRVKEVLSKTLKRFANPFNYKEPQWNFTSRIMQPIKFSGPNRIVGIVFDPKSHEDQPEVWYGTIPDQFVKDWQERVGKWNPKQVEGKR